MAKIIYPSAHAPLDPEMLNTLLITCGMDPVMAHKGFVPTSASTGTVYERFSKGLNFPGNDRIQWPLEGTLTGDTIAAASLTISPGVAYKQGYVLQNTADITETLANYGIAAGKHYALMLSISLPAYTNVSSGSVVDNNYIMELKQAMFGFLEFNPDAPDLSAEAPFQLQNADLHDSNAANRTSGIILGHLDTTAAKPIFSPARMYFEQGRPAHRAGKVHVFRTMSDQKITSAAGFQGMSADRGGLSATTKFKPNTHYVFPYPVKSDNIPYKVYSTGPLGYYANDRQVIILKTDGGYPKQPWTPGLNDGESKTWLFEDYLHYATDGASLRCMRTGTYKFDLAYNCYGGWSPNSSYAQTRMFGAAWTIRRGANAPAGVQYQYWLPQRTINDNNIKSGTDDGPNNPAVDTRNAGYGKTEAPWERAHSVVYITLYEGDVISLTQDIGNVNITNGTATSPQTSRVSIDMLNVQVAYMGGALLQDRTKIDPATGKYTKDAYAKL